jgi:WhiB family transcriptional regulator, redox-sensing transcriptional regulator
VTAGFWDDRAVTDTAWMTDALCGGTSPKAWFPVGAGGRNARTNEDRENEQARACRPCPVREECLWYALTHRIEDGVWGGQSAAGRRRILRQQRAAYRYETGMTDTGERVAPSPAVAITSVVSAAIREAIR